MPKDKQPTWLAGLVGIVRYYAKHNTDTALAFVASPDAFKVLTESQRCQLFNAAMSLFGMAYEMPRAGGNRRGRRWDADVFAAAMAEVEGKEHQPFRWVHQRYAPLVAPGEPRLPSLSQQYEAMRESGAFGKDAPEYVDAVQEATYDAKRNPDGPILSIPTSGGYRLAVKADVPENEKRSKGKGKTLTLKDLL